MISYFFEVITINYSSLKNAVNAVISRDSSLKPLVPWNATFNSENLLQEGFKEQQKM